MSTQLLCPSQIQDGFLAAPPLLTQTIEDRTIKTPVWGRDLYQIEEMPLGHGNQVQQLIFRGAMPQIERGLGAWDQAGQNTGCEPCADHCGYNWSDFGGSGIERKIAQVIKRDFRSPTYCIEEIQTTFDFETIMTKIIENLYAQVSFFKEMNIGLNVLTMLAKKYVVDSGGPKINTADIYTYPNIGTARLAKLNIDMLAFFYEWLKRAPDAIPFDVQNGAPIYAMVASPQLLADLYRDDPNLRQDIRFSGLANDLVTKYNFLSTIQGMYFPVPIMWPRRFNIVAGEPVEVLPTINGLPLEAGVYTGPNPAYELATHEEVILHGQYPFKIFYRQLAETVGSNTSFGPAPSFLNYWSWINPLTQQDPWRLSGFFATRAQIAIAPEFSDAILAILVERKNFRLMAVFNPEPVCPPTPVECDNEIPATGCPCPLVTNFIPNPIADGTYFVYFTVPQDLVATDPIQVGLSSGGYLDGEVVNVSGDGLIVEVDFDGAVLDSCVTFTSVFCDNTLGCSSAVIRSSVNTTTATLVDLVLSSPIKAVTAADVINITLCDGTVTTATVSVVDQLTNTWTVDPAGTLAEPNCVAFVCVPTSTDATCPACEGTITQCT